MGKGIQKTSVRDIFLAKRSTTESLVDSTSTHKARCGANVKYVWLSVV